MSWLSSFLHPGQGYDKAQQQMDQYYQQGQGYLQPYNQYGQNAYGNLSGAMNALLDPQALQDKWMKGYQESEAAKSAESMAQQHGLDAASSLGLMGSTPALSAIQAGTTQIGLEDQQNYLDNLMQKYLAGAGIAQGIFGQGANAAGQMGQNAMNMGQNSAQMAFGKANAGGNLFGNLLGMGAGLAGSALGGPIGGALANKWGLTGGSRWNNPDGGVNAY